MKRCVVDCETLGVGNNPVILAIGAVVINDDDAAPSRDRQPVMYHNISIESCLKAGLTVTEGTLVWWMKQPEDPRMAIVHGQSINPMTLEAALFALSCLYKDNGCEEIWSYGATADVIWLQSAYAATGKPCPWTYRDARCLRTLGEVKDPDGALWPEPAVKHHALEDALAEAVWLSRLLQ